MPARDMDLVRKILAAVESVNDPDQILSKVVVDGYEQRLVDYHLDILRDHDLITWADDEEETAAAAFKIRFVDLRLTWDGHEFLDNARNDGVWRQVKALLKDRDIKSASFSIWANLISQVIASNLNQAASG
jgi:hypothetical protein